MILRGVVLILQLSREQLKKDELQRNARSVYKGSAEVSTKLMPLPGGQNVDRQRSNNTATAAYNCYCYCYC
jgi:hypothetical protein